jgi:hypothetical protein
MSRIHPTCCICKTPIKTQADGRFLTPHQSQRLQPFAYCTIKEKVHSAHELCIRQPKKYMVQQVQHRLVAIT